MISYRWVISGRCACQRQEPEESSAPAEWCRRGREEKREQNKNTRSLAGLAGQTQGPWQPQFIPRLSWAVLTCFCEFFLILAFFGFPLGCPSQTESLKERWPCSQSCYLSFNYRCDSGLFVENEFAHKNIKNVTQGLTTILMSMSSTRHQFRRDSVSSFERTHKIL